VFRGGELAAKVERLEARESVRAAEMIVLKERMRTRAALQEKSNAEQLAQLKFEMEKRKAELEEATVAKRRQDAQLEQLERLLVLQALDPAFDAK
jgi:hypothetical protein